MTSSTDTVRERARRRAFMYAEVHGTPEALTMVTTRYPLDSPEAVSALVGTMQQLEGMQIDTVDVPQSAVDLLADLVGTEQTGFPLPVTAAAFYAEWQVEHSDPADLADAAPGVDPKVAQLADRVRRLMDERRLGRMFMRGMLDEVGAS